MQETKISIQNKFNEKLVGIETIPSVEKSKYPTVILAHGFGVRKEEGGMFDEIAKRLSETGILVYRFDFSGCGESEGDYSQTSLTKLKNDLKEILRFVRNQEKVDGTKVGILAQSFGTSVTVALEPDVKAIILMGSLSEPIKSFSEYFGEGYNPEGVSVIRRSNGRTTRVGPQFWKDFNNHNLLKSIKNIKCPILFIHGSEDEKVPLSQMEAYFDVANDLKKKIILEGAYHSLKPHREKMYQIVTDWFTEYLTQSKQKEIELRVCKKFVELYNEKFPEEKLKDPWLSGKDDEFPDCETLGERTGNKLELEVMVASPKEMEDLQRRPRKPTTYEKIRDSTNVVPDIEQLYNDIKEKKTDKYKKQSIGFEDSVLLLEKAHIEYDIIEMSNFIKKNKEWQNKGRNLGFKEIWYVSTDRIDWLW